MFDFITGTLVSIDSSSAVLDVGGVGFKLGMSNIALSQLPPIGSPITIYTTLIVRSEALDLYGFADANERGLFDRLISVSGVGPKVALSALSTFNSETLQKLIVDEDVKRLTTIPGLGKKTAQRLILELKGTLVALDEANYLTKTATANAGSEQVIDALLGMGFTKKEIELASIGYDGPTNDVEQHVRYTLKRLGGA